MVYENALQKKCKLKVLTEPEIQTGGFGTEECHFLANLEFEDRTKVEKQKVWFPTGIPNTHIPKKDDEFQAKVAKNGNEYNLIEICT